LQNFRESERIQREAFKCLPHNRRQVNFIFLTNDMNFKGTWPKNPLLSGSKEIEIVNCVRETRKKVPNWFTDCHALMYCVPRFPGFWIDDSDTLVPPS